jgi:hypothetical protein
VLGLKWGNCKPSTVGNSGAVHPQVDKPMLQTRTCSGRRGGTHLCVRDARVALPTLQRCCREEDSDGRIMGAR